MTRPPDVSGRPSSSGFSRFSEMDQYLLAEGTHYRLYEKLGAHVGVLDSKAGTQFTVWAPNALSVAVIGDFNDWDASRHPLTRCSGSGVWESFLPGVAEGARYKYRVTGPGDGYRADKADPVGFQHEQPPSHASLVRRLKHSWADSEWMASRGRKIALESPISIYEVHLGSWMRVPEEGDRPLTYRELAPRLADYALAAGFTHVEFLPLMEHPFYGSWGYQVTGYFAPTSRYGEPQDLMYLIDFLHQRGVGVILDWVPSHFCRDEHGLGFFDGTHLYEPSDPRYAVHPDWNSFLFDYERNEVRSFLLSNALFWLDVYHADGLRVDAVASMLYHEGPRSDGGGSGERVARDKPHAVSFLRQLNEQVHRAFPDVAMIAEESTAWPQVSRPASSGGLGFDYKWDLGWKYDTLEYLSRDATQRAQHHEQLTFRSLYAFNENFVLPLSHDEVAPGSASLLARMPGDDWQKLANLRLLLGYLYSQPGKKLLFMGNEFAQRREWDHDRSLDWHIRDAPQHAGVWRWVRDANLTYRAEPALHALDASPGGFEWVDGNDSLQSVLVFLRKGPRAGEEILVVCNFTPIPRKNYRVGAPRGGFWNEILNSDAEIYGGSGQGNLGGVEAAPIPCHGRPCSLTLTLPPLAALFLKPTAHAS